MSSRRAPPADDFIHRRCVFCQEVTRTRAKRAWRCQSCGKRNSVTWATPVRPNELKEYKQVGLPV